MTLERAVDVFGVGFTYTRSFTHPFEYTRVGPLRVMRDLPRKSGDYRSQEILPFGLTPAEAAEAIRAYRPPRFFVSAIDSMEAPLDQIKEEYKALGFRLLRREPMMVRRLEGVEVRPGPFPVMRVTTAEQSEAVAAAAGRYQILERDLLREDSDLRLYAAFDGTRAVGWVRSIRADAGASWVSNMYIVEEYRRRGLATALMTEMMADDAHHGLEWSVLLASNAGARLYPTIGYVQIGVDQLFAPDKNRWP